MRSLMRRTLEVLCLTLAFSVVGCLPEREPESDLLLYFIKVNPQDLTTTPWRVRLTSSGSTVGKEPAGGAANGISYIFTEPRNGGSGFAFLLAGDVWINTSCADRRRLTNSGAAAMPTLSEGGCGQVAYLDNTQVLVGGVSGGAPAALGPAAAVHVSPDGTKVLLVLDDVLSVCMITGADCTVVDLPTGSDANTATFSPDSQHVLFRVSANERMQLAMVNFDGSGVRQLTQLTGADVVIMQPIALFVAFTLQYGPADFRIATLDLTDSSGEWVTRVSGGWNTFALTPQ